MSGDADGIAGAVVEGGQDLGVSAVGQAVVSEVGPAALVGQVRLEVVVGDGVSTGVEPPPAEPLPKREDHLDRLGRGGVRAAPRQTRTRLECRVTLTAPPRQQLRHPPLRHTVGACGLCLREALDGGGGDNQGSFRHPQSVAEGFLCRETWDSYVLKLDTVPATNETRARLIWSGPCCSR